MGNRLLLADDSITIQKVVAIIFANEEFELTVVDNGIAALQQARELRPDVMLVDALMPGKSGYEVCAEIRRDPSLSSTPILLLIGAFEPFDEEKAHNCGADASITKPFESQQLIDRVKELLDLGKTRSAAPAPAPVASAMPLVESAAEELWGDLSAFDTMPPIAPAASAAPAAAAPKEATASDFFARPAAPAPLAPAPVTAAPVAPVAAAAAPAFAAAKPSPTAVPAPAAAAQQFEEIEEASYEDDLWGAFDLEEAPKKGAPAADAFGALGAEPEFEAEEFFSFEDESEVIEETGPAIGTASGSGLPEQAQQPSAEELFSFAEEAPLCEVAASPVDPYSFPVEEPFSFEPEAEPAAPVFPEEPVLAPSIPALQPLAAAESASAAQPATFTLSEADLIAAISKVSREVIERIVWEVVPDLAEVLIKEEIRKLKAGIKG